MKIAPPLVVLLTFLTSAPAALALDPETVSDLPSLKSDLIEEKADFARAGVFPVNTDLPLGGFDELVPFVQPAPDQEDAGSCLYMSLTGVAEWWLARLHPEVPRVPNGPIDLSERYFMNLGGSVPNWRTDAVLRFNLGGHRAVRNSAYPFIKGWYTGTNSDDTLQPALASTPGAKYGVYLNWYDDRQSIKGGWVDLPEFSRRVIFADADQDQWAIGVAPQDIVEKVKSTLAKEKIPVQVIYNHNGYWHSVFIVGFNDDLFNGNCAYTERFRTKMVEKLADLQKELEKATTSEERKQIQARIKKTKATQSRMEKIYANGGGCTSSKGAFYIRDSIYPDENGPVYDYDPTNSGPAPDEAPYAKKIVTKEYDWLRYFANHVIAIRATE